MKCWPDVYEYGVPGPTPHHTRQDRFPPQAPTGILRQARPPPGPGKPIPVNVIRHIIAADLIAATVDNVVVADMIALAFFFLLRPGEYTGTHSETSTFRFCDVQLFIGLYRLDPFTADFTTIRSATFTSPTVADQKNGVRGEVIGLSRSGNIQLCPVLSVIRRVIHMREHQAPPTTPLASHFLHQKWHPIKPTDISAVLRLAVGVLGPGLGFSPQDVSARSLRASGGMALLCAHVDTKIIKLLGWSRCDEMLRYLHVQAEPVMRNFASRILNHRSFVLTPGPGIDVPTL
jgi:hypothetical protein